MCSGREERGEETGGGQGSANARVEDEEGGCGDCDGGLHGCGWIGRVEVLGFDVYRSGGGVSVVIVSGMRREIGVVEMGALVVRNLSYGAVQN